MTEKLALVQPEIALFVTTCVVMVIGLAKSYAARRACATVAAVGVALAGLLALNTPANDGALLPGLVPFAKTLVAAVGLVLLLLLGGVIDRDVERSVRAGTPFDPRFANRGEFYSFFLFSLTGVMLCASADDLIWLFLALELTSLPTYIMVAISTGRLRSQEAAVKYFFLGAFGAATFLFGFAMLYGAAGSTNLNEIAAVFARDGLGALGAAGLVMALVGVSFKIAAVPMHFYTPDVYEGSAAPVAAYLAFAPKAAGFFAIILLVSTVGWSWGADGDSLPDAVHVTLWAMAALTMTVGNVMALLQRSVKRILAYSSVAHSGYMLVGVIVGPGSGSFWHNGLGATLFYLLCYGFMNIGAFAALACVERRGAHDDDELETLDDVRGLCKSRPAVGWAFVLCAFSLLGMPPLLGFFGKLLLFTSAISAGEIALVVVLGLNSAIAAYYYLRLAAMAYFEPADARAGEPLPTPFRGRMVAAVISGASVLALLPFLGPLTRASVRAGTPGAEHAALITSDAAPAPRAEAATPQE